MYPRRPNRTSKQILNGSGSIANMSGYARIAEPLLMYRVEYRLSPGPAGWAAQFSAIRRKDAISESVSVLEKDNRIMQKKQ